MARQGEITKKARLHALLTEREVVLVDPPLMAELRTALAPISDSYFEDLLRNSGVPLHPLFLHSPEDLRRTLILLAELYESSPNPRAVRERVIAASAKRCTFVSACKASETMKAHDSRH